ncbi:MAG TPA: TonB-dependent receptor [Prolixibacteraceae bacterium]|nr:TonB-dependent receptor [Prolixibacteraceae bacterium]HOS91610.1 TonB-dependent receptor [Prolixibacteraceae bacterium]HPL44433.1 TonB-dependent receptor [Prolixibacteraceae bacterium]HPV19588.1 TonB-dependent receptor [Prolixibacteraceae bacterium]HQJ86826.1 TonB-dependent receptor [Prolixibacteraceae bacterium]
MKKIKSFHECDFSCLTKTFRIMRITVFLMLAVILQTFANEVYSQKTKLSLDYTNTRLEDVLDEIEEFSEFFFLANEKLVDLNRNVNLSVKNKKIDEILDILFAGTDVVYTITDRKIILAPSFLTEHAQQQRTISGKVTDSGGQPLPGVTVVKKGTTQGTVTNAYGDFSLANIPEDATLVFSFVGMRTVEVVVGNQATINVTLEIDAIGIEEVVAVGYGTQRKVNLTGSVAAIEATDLANKPVATTSQAIAGLVPGLSVVQNSGRPGTSATVRIRGTGTFSSAGNNPLVLIDGMAGSIDDVSPDDVESISFLKDAASASIYGSRAANGVILIQTNKGKDGKFRVSYNNSLGWQKPTELPDFLSSWEYATYYNEAMENMGNSAAYTTEQIQKFKDGSDLDNYPNVNHLEWLLNSGSGFQQRHNIGLQGGNDRIIQNFSIGYWKQDGMTAKTSNERYNVLWNTKSKLLESLTLDTHLNSYTNLYKAPNGEPQSIDGIIGYAVRQGPIYAGHKSDGSFGYQDSYSPEAWLASESFVKNNVVNITGTVQFSWATPIKGLSVSGKTGITYNTNYNKAYRAKTYFDDSKTVGPATLSVVSGNNTYKAFEGLVKYEKQLASHSINILAGSTFDEYKENYLTGYRNTFPNNYLYELTSGAASSMSNNGYSNEWSLLSYFGRINYSYLDRYLMEMNARYDGSSRFASNGRWGFFPSVSAGWRISQENFWQNSELNNVINNLKLRGSWGVLGNQNIGTYPYQQTYSLGQNAVWGSPGTMVSGARITTFNNPEITWETTRILNIGIDFNLWSGKINGGIDYFDKYTDNILSSVQVTRIMGRSVGQSNIGAVSNKGIEINIEYNTKFGKDVRLSFAPNFTYIQNAVEELADGALTDINNNRIVGEPLGIIYGYKTNGLFVDQDEINAAPNQLISKGGLKPGYICYKDISGPDGVPDGMVNSTYDRSVIGSTTPKFYYGLSINASYIGFDFSALLQGLGGHQRLIGSYMAYTFYNGGQIQQWQVDNRWTTKNPDKWAKYPRLETLNMSNTNLQVSDYWLRDASFLRIKNVQLGYTFTKSFVSQLGLQQLRVFFSGQNLYNFNSFYKGWDPENEIPTGDAPSFYPINSIYSFGINAKF